MRLLTGTLMVVAALAACDSGPSVAGTVGISAEAYGEAWPFSVAEAELSCPDRYPALTAAGITYGLTMGGQMKGLANIGPIRNIRPDLAEKFGERAAEMGAPLPLMNMDAIVEMALGLCDD